VDELWYNLRARDFLLTGQLEVFYQTFWGGMHPAMVILTAPVQALGWNSPVASRAISAIGGVLTVPLAYACFSELWRNMWPAARRRATAALAATILSSLLYLFVAARIGQAPALVPPLMLAYVWQVRRAQRTGRWAGWIVAGAALGLAQYVNHNGRFLVLLAIVMGLYDLGSACASQRWRVCRGLMLVAGTAVLVALPLINFFIHEPQWLLARARVIQAGGQAGKLAWLWENAVRVAAAFSFHGDPNHRHNFPGRPMLDAFQSLGLGVGVLWNLKAASGRRAVCELLGWTALMTIASLITDDAPNFERMIGAGIPAAGLVAAGWVEVWTWGDRIGMAKGRSLGQAAAAKWLAGAMFVISLGSGVYDYFVRYPQTSGLDAAFTTTPVRVAEDLLARAQTELVFVERITEAEDVFAFDFLFPNSAVRRLDFRQCLPLASGHSTRTTYLVLAERDADSAERLSNAYPEAAYRWIRPETAALMGEAYQVEVPAGMEASLNIQAAPARFEGGVALSGYESSGMPVKPGESVFLTLYWKAERDLNLNWTRFVHLYPENDTSNLIAQADSFPCQGLYPTAQWRAGVVIPDGLALTIPAGTPPGRYTLAIGWYHYPSLERLPLEWAQNALSDNRVVISTLDVMDP